MRLPPPWDAARAVQSQPTHPRTPVTWMPAGPTQLHTHTDIVI